MTSPLETQAVEAILAANSAENRWMVEARVDKLDELLAPDFVLVHITGYQQSKAEWLDQIRTGRMSYHGIREQSVTVRVDETEAVLVARNHVDATIWGSKAVWPLQMTTVFAEVGGVWRPTRSRATTF